MNKTTIFSLQIKTKYNLKSLFIKMTNIIVYNEHKRLTISKLNFDQN